MARYLADQNSVSLIHESGTYASSSGNTYWIGQVTNNEVEDLENKIFQRFLGTANRNYDSVEPGPRDVTGTLTYFPQDMRIVFFGIGSIVSTSGPNAVHLVTEINNAVRQSPWTSGTLNPPISFTVQDAKQWNIAGSNSIRTINGCIPNQIVMSASEGEKVITEVSYLGQTLTYSSGAPTTLPTQNTNTPYLWSHCTVQVSGNTMPTVKSFEFTVNQNTVGPHYLNGSRDISVPYQANRDYSFTITTDWEATTAKLIYETLYKNNAAFNCLLDLNADSTAGSQHAIFLLSGCRIANIGLPSPMEGTNEATIEIIPQYVVGSEFTSQASLSRFGPF